MRKRCKGMRGLKTFFTLLGLLYYTLATGQVTGGQFAMEFLRMANSPHVSALGGISVANPDNDISLALQNPAMMRPGLHNQLALSYNSFYGGIKIMNLQYGYHSQKLNTSFFGGVQYLNYGSFSETDNTGNIIGDFHGVDYAVTVGASRKYGEHWRYGAAVKFAQSKYAEYGATAALVDVGVNYYDTASLIDFGIVAKNMGSMITKYNPDKTAEPLPFDLQLGISKRFKHMPLRLYATLHHLYEWDIRYDNPTDNITTNILGTTDSSKLKGDHTVDKIFRHFIFGAELSIGKRLLATVSYNDLQRRELAVSTKPGKAGFSFGLALNLDKFQVHYARNYYHLAGAYNEIGLNLALNKLFSIGKFGEKVGWGKEYGDWD